MVEIKGNCCSRFSISWNANNVRGAGVRMRELGLRVSGNLRLSLLRRLDSVRKPKIKDH